MTQNLPAPLVLIDGSSYFYRAFHALPPLTNSKGQPTGAIYGVINMVKRLINDYKPTHVGVVFDAPGKTFRDSWFPAYKAHRPPTPADLRVQFEPLWNLLQHLGIKTLMVEGVEADDVIATLVEWSKAHNEAILISTGDKDLAQLVNHHVTLINTMSQQRLDEHGVKLKFGVNPDQIIDYLSLIGDKSDNIPGIPQCGPKTAVKWLTQYHTIANLVSHANDISGKIGESLRAHLDQLALSQRLVTLKKDVELNLSLADLNLKSPNHEALIELVEHLEFKTWLKELHKTQAQAVTPTPSRPIPSTMAASNSCANALHEALQHASLISLHVQCENNQGISSITLATPEKGCFFVAIDDNPAMLAPIKPYLENPSIAKIGHDLKRDYARLAEHGVMLSGMTFDTMIEAYVHNSSLKNYQLQHLITTYLPGLTTNHNAMAEMILKLHDELFHHQLTPALQHLLQNIEMPLVTILAKMEQHGVLIDTAQLAQQSQRLTQLIDALAQQAHHLAGQVFNLNSPKQLLTIMYTELNYPVLSKTPKGQPSTGEEVLQELAIHYPLPAIILEYRGLTKLMSTYIEALPQHINPLTHRIHTSYNQAITTTGRLSSSDPNLQNIPIKTHEGRLIRQAFIAPTDCLLLTADYSQIELRIMAHLSQDPGLIRAFNQGLDIHSATACELFNATADQVSAEQRRRAKAINFGLIYGMSAFGLAKQLRIERADAQHYINTYFERYPGVLNYMEETRAMAYQHGHVDTLFGRRLYIPEIRSANKTVQKAGERMAINAPMQGTAADIIKLAMKNVNDWLCNNNVSMIMQVHDELVFEVPHDLIASVEPEIKRIMENAVTLDVPLIVCTGSGANWNSAHQ